MQKVISTVGEKIAEFVFTWIGGLSWKVMLVTLIIYGGASFAVFTSNEYHPVSELAFLWGMATMMFTIVVTLCAVICVLQGKYAMRSVYKWRERSWFVGTMWVSVATVIAPLNIFFLLAPDLIERHLHL